MTDHYSTLLLAWVLLALIGGWVLVNALIDLGARRFRRWWTERWAHRPPASPIATASSADADRVLPVQ